MMEDGRSGSEGMVVGGQEFGSGVKAVGGQVVESKIVENSEKPVIDENKPSQKDKIKEILEGLEKGVKNVFNSEAYKEFLTFMGKFYNYSANNNVLIHNQMPHATRVGSYNLWKSLGRYPRKGEHGIKILAPCPYKKEQDVVKVDARGNPILGTDGNPIRERIEKIIQGYKPAHVFDISQTEGKPVPEIVSPLTGDVKDYDRFMKALKEVSPVPIELKPIAGSANGYYHLEDKRIAIDEALSERQIAVIKTGIHEIAHALLHDKDRGKEKDNLPDKRTKEIEAESIAYVVCQHFGLDTSSYSFGYIAGWAQDKDVPQLKSSLNIIRNTASEIITGIEKSLDKSKEKEVVCSQELDRNEAVVHSQELDRGEKVVCSEERVVPALADKPIKVYCRGR